MIEPVYYKQETEYTCGPACLRMVLAGFGLKKSEKVIARMLGVTPQSGTWYKSFVEVVETLKYNYAVMRHATLDDMQEYQKKGYMLIVSYYIADEKYGHYSVLKKIDKEYIYFMDPWFGEDVKYKKKDFLKMWHSDPKLNNEKRWFLAIQKPSKV